MKISLIAAITNNRVLGNKGTIPWKSDADMRHFKNMTTGKPVIMGYNTWISLNRSKGLPDRLNVVVTDRHLEAVSADIMAAGAQEQVIVASTLDAAILGCAKLQHLWGEEIWIIGGAKLYEQSLLSGIIDEVVLTRFPELEVEGDTFLIEFEALTDENGELMYELINEPKLLQDTEPLMQLEYYARLR